MELFPQFNLEFFIAFYFFVVEILNTVALPGSQILSPPQICDYCCLLLFNSDSFYRVCILFHVWPQESLLGQPIHLLNTGLRFYLNAWNQKISQSLHLDRGALCVVHVEGGRVAHTGHSPRQPVPLFAFSSCLHRAWKSAGSENVGPSLGLP